MAAEEAIRVRLGARADAGPEELRALSTDASVMVRGAVAMNPSTPPETNALLARDADERVRALLAGKLAALMPALSDAGRARLRQLTLETLTALATDETVRVRAAIAEVVKDLPEAPREIILRLAHDAEMTVCEPVIRFSPLLSSDDLIALVTAAPSAATGVAVARRAAIDAAVSDAVAAGGTEDAILALLMNGSAQIREATLDALVDRSIDHPDWHGPLARRPLLSGRSVRTLSRIVADHLLETLAARGDLDPAVAADLRTRVAAKMRAPAAAPTPATAAGRPTEEQLLRTARAGDAAAAAAMLAAAADVPLAMVRRAAGLRSAKGLVSLAWKAGFSMHAGHAMQVLLAGLPPGAALRPGPGNSFPLSTQEMSWQIEFLRGDET